jgi:hypothetical protein
VFLPSQYVNHHAATPFKHQRTTYRLLLYETTPCRAAMDSGSAIFGGIWLSKNMTIVIKNKLFLAASDRRKISVEKAYFQRTLPKINYFLWHFLPSKIIYFWWLTYFWRLGKWFGGNWLIFSGVGVLYLGYRGLQVMSQKIWIRPNSLQRRMAGESLTLYQIWSHHSRPKGRDYQHKKI